VHRTSGRIYKVVYGEPKAAKGVDLAKSSDADLVAFQLHVNDWYVRQARRLLQERAIAGKDLTEAHATLRKMLAGNADVTRKLRALWALYSSGGMPGKDLLSLLDHENEHVRAWAVRLIVDERAASAPAVEKFASMAARMRRRWCAFSWPRPCSGWGLRSAGRSCRPWRRTPRMRKTPISRRCSGTDGAAGGDGPGQVVLAGGRV